MNSFNTMEQTPCLEAKHSSAGQEIACKEAKHSLPSSEEPISCPVLCQINPVHTLPS